MSRVSQSPLLFHLLILLLLGASSCSAAEDPPAGGAQVPAETPRPAERDTDGHAREAAAGQHGPADTDSLPLLPIMLQMEVDMSGLMQALWREDYEQVSAHAAAVAGHPGVSAQELDRIKTELGPEMGEFVAADEAVHQASVDLHEAADARELNRLLEKLAEVQRGCVDCHSRFRERLSTRRPGN